MDLQRNDFRRMSVEEFDTTKLLAHASRQAKERGYEKFPIVDVDSHHYENESMPEILEYLDDPVLKQLALAGSKPNAKNARILNTMVGYQDMGGRIPRYGLRSLEKAPPGKDQRDAALTKRWMDAVGVDVAVLFPTPMVALGVHPQVEVEIALSRAYNRWLCERVLSAEPRLVSMLYLPFNDPGRDLCLRQGVRGEKGRGWLSHNLNALSAGARQPVHENLCATGRDGPADRLPRLLSLARPGAGHAQPLHLGACARIRLVQHVHLANWIINGIPERFPKLKVMWLESGLAWIPFMMQRFDNEYMMRTSEAPALKKLPSDYMRDMYFASQPMEITDMGLLENTMRVISAETQLVYSSDYPHWDFDLPSTIYDLPFLSEQAKRNILGGNAMRLFNLKLGAEKLARVA